MAKRKTAAAVKPKGPMQTMLDRETIEAATAPLVNRFAEQHGHYTRNLRFVVNEASTAVDRWRRDGNMTVSQLAAVNHCQQLWAKLGSQGVVVDFDKVRGHPHGAGYLQHEALAELHRIGSQFPRNLRPPVQNRAGNHR
jgi:hypothetical protein